jgi:cytosine/uracil/thiamine/allantoin permease
MNGLKMRENDGRFLEYFSYIGLGLNALVVIGWLSTMMINNPDYLKTLQIYSACILTNDIAIPVLMIIHNSLAKN